MCVFLIVLKRSQEIREREKVDEMYDGCKELSVLMEKVFRERGWDFREYKESTLTRRLRQRLNARRVKTYTDYARILDMDPAEYDKLFDVLLIGVTSFFRDEAAFGTLRERVLPVLIKRHVGVHGGLRIWDAGCGTGEEPYSIAILLSEILGQEMSRWNITIFATDIAVGALNRARNGVFTGREVTGIQPAWLDKYFTRKNNHFSVIPVLRQLIAFSVHNLVSDPFFKDLDLVVCRNVLIYFNSALQTRVLKDFHDGLRKEGFLLLGKSEAPIGEVRALFACLDSKAKLFQKVAT